MGDYFLYTENCKYRKEGKLLVFLLKVFYNCPVFEYLLDFYFKSDNNFTQAIGLSF